MQALLLKLAKFLSTFMLRTPLVSCCVGYTTYPMSTAGRGPQRRGRGHRVGATRAGGT